MELLQIITEQLEQDPSIFDLRLVSKPLNSAATPLALRVIVVKDSVKSADAVSFLQGCDESVTSLPCLKDIFLPRLASLSLHYFDFGPLKPEADVVEFILRHNALLTRLELHKCSIDCSERGEVPRPWHAVLAVFEAKLHSLREFVYESRPSPRHSLFEYTQFAPGWGLVSFSPWNGEVAGVHRDLSALESLQAMVQSRRGSKDDSQDL
ncbi:hypothetical protein DFH06DRAFT_1316862 [Mycena polygramma]|nr:hypothetical protein DFH06DRAFT_1316862 [Mycena polygramma]